MEREPTWKEKKRLEGGKTAQRVLHYPDRRIRGRRKQKRTKQVQPGLRIKGKGRAVGKRGQRGNTAYSFGPDVNNKQNGGKGKERREKEGPPGKTGSTPIRNLRKAKA